MKSTSYEYKNFSKFLLGILTLISIITFYNKQLFENNNSTYFIFSLVSYILLLNFNQKNHIKIFYTIIIISVYLMSIYLNGVLNASRSLPPYLAITSTFYMIGPIKNINFSNYDLDKIKNIINLILWIGFLQLLLYQIFAILSPYYNFLYSTDEFYRESISWISIIAFFISVINIGRFEELRGFYRFIMIYLLFFIPLCLFLNSSRSEILICAILFLIGLYKVKKSYSLIFIPLAIVISIFSISSASLSRFEGAIDEIFNADTLSSVAAYDNYRSYESSLQIEKIESRGLFAAIGCGLGCAVKPDIILTLQEKNYDEVSIFHNGLLTVIMQFGIFGIFIIMYFIKSTWISFKKILNSRYIIEIEFYSLAFAPLLVLTLTSFTTGGFMSLYDGLIMLLPFSVFAYARK